MRKYNVIIFKNEQRKLAHVAISHTEIKQKITPQVLKSKAEYWKNNFGEIKANHSHTFVHFMFLNSEVNEWEYQYFMTNVDKEDALSFKKDIIHTMHLKGYTISDRTVAYEKRNLFSGENIPVEYYGTFIASKTDLKKFKKFCEKCTMGMNITYTKFVTVMNSCYKKLLELGEISKYEIWKNFQNA